MMKVIVLCVMLCTSVLALTESEAGHNDWYRANIGRLRQLHPPSKAFKGLLVSSEQGVLAALDPRDGSIIWRQVLPENYPILSSDVSETCKLCRRFSPFVDS
jgi:hypothetical protein